MTDIDALLERLRVVANDHVVPEMPERVAVRRWPPDTGAGARHVYLEQWAASRPWRLSRFLVPDHEDFVELAFLACVGRPPDAGGRSHYLARLQQGTPRIELLAVVAGSPEAATFLGAAPWPWWLRPALWSLRAPTAFGRRVARGVLRRLERIAARRARASHAGEHWRMAVREDERDRARQDAWDAVASRVDAAAERLDRHATAVERRIAELSSGLERDGHAIASLRARLAAAEYTRPEHVPAAAAPAPADALARYYVALEAVFRGDPDRIRTQLHADYAEIVERARRDAGAGPCIDLGCGRGEWLDVLAGLGLEARGVEASTAMAEAARSAGRDVAVADAVAYLADQPGDSVLLVTAFHLAEHLPFAALFRLVAECRRVLKPGGLLILETPNPENVWVATHTFHHDPTHAHPLTPTSLEFLVNHHGLETVAVLRLHPYPETARLPGQDPASERLNAMLCGGQDFAVVARKTVPA